MQDTEHLDRIKIRADRQTRLLGYVRDHQTSAETMLNSAEYELEKLREELADLLPDVVNVATPQKLEEAA